MTEPEERSVQDQLQAAIEAVVASEENAKQANIERKAARNNLAQILQGMGVTGFQIGG